MKKYLSLFTLLIILLIIWEAFNFFVPRENKKILTNVTELYSRFAPHTKKYTDYYLKGINCKPTKYYYKSDTSYYSNGNLIPFYCFICGKYDACFGYGLIHLDFGKKMSIRDAKLSGDYTMNDFYNFYTFGIAKILNCKCEENCTCENGIKLKMVEPTGPIFYFPEDVKKEQIEKIANKWGVENECVITQNETIKGYNIQLFECEDLIVRIINNREVMFGI